MVSSEKPVERETRAQAQAVSRQPSVWKNHMKRAQVTAAVSSLLLASVVQAGVLFPNKTIDIAFTGYCDGMRLVINHTTGIVTGNSTGCISDPAIGTAGGLSKIGAGLTVRNRAFLFVIDDNARKWDLYNADGSFNSSGEYTVGVPSLSSRQALFATGE
jgi:hypothetical protein